MVQALFFCFSNLIFPHALQNDVSIGARKILVVSHTPMRLTYLQLPPELHYSSTAETHA